MLWSYKIDTVNRTTGNGRVPQLFPENLPPPTSFAQFKSHALPARQSLTGMVRILS